MKNDSDGVGHIVIADLALILFGSWALSKKMGVDLNTFWTIAPIFALFTGISGWMLRSGDFLTSTCVTVFAFGVWIALWPALNYWAVRHEVPFNLYDDFANTVVTTVWWGQWYTKMVGLLVIAGCSWGYRRAQSYETY